MLNILLTGCCGRMGHAIRANLPQDCRILAGVDLLGEADFPVYRNIADVKEKCDVMIDFSNHVLTKDILDYAVKNQTPCVICTTGQTESELEYIEKCSEKVAVFRSGNMSLGINLIMRLAAEAAKTLGDDFDIEIIEKHHRNKLDAPSGTAIMIADEIKAEMSEDTVYTYGRADRRTVRPKCEIGISSVRGGDIVGEHEVLFCGNGEVISVKHTAETREVFASGAIRAAVYLADKSAGMYSMKQLIKDSALAEKHCRTH